MAAGAEGDDETLKICLERVEDCWRRLGETEPHWSVVANPMFRSERIGETIDEFYATGEHDLRRWMEMAERGGVQLPSRATCLELGCGVGRVTLWLSRMFERVIGLDVSPSHLALAEQLLRKEGRHNVELRRVNTLEAFRQLPDIDCFFSMIVLQHNPPPVMRWMLLRILSKLNPGGGGVFQVLTKLPGYSFDPAAYLARPATASEMEMHVLPFDAVVETVKQAGCEVVISAEHDCIGHAGSESIEFLIRKLDPANGLATVRTESPVH
ncbi:MAG: class I SAM-dependent methyltransferase [Reyranellaceae bacterium]